MSDFIGDLSSYVNQMTNASLANASSRVKVKDNSKLEMQDFLMLMVAQFQNQTIDNTADTSDMLNQLVQMSMIEAITNITDATTMMYSSSLVGKEVTIGEYDGEKLVETVGTVTGTGMSGGQQVVFVNGKSYYLNQIMAVGRLPAIDETTPDTGETEGEQEGDIIP